MIKRKLLGEMTDSELIEELQKGANDFTQPASAKEMSLHFDINREILCRWIVWRDRAMAKLNRLGKANRKLKDRINRLLTE